VQEQQHWEWSKTKNKYSLTTTHKKTLQSVGGKVKEQPGGQK